MGNRYHVKSSAMTLGENTFDMATGPHAKGQTREALDVTALSDVFKQFIPGALTEDDEFVVTIYDPGVTNRPKVSDAPMSCSFAVALSNGSSTSDVNANFSYTKVIVTKVAPPSHEGNGERKATVDVTLRPTGEQPTAQT